MNSDFVPKNELEKKLLAAQNGELSGDQFMKELLTSEVFMPILDKHNIGGLQDSAQANPLTLTGDDNIETLILFTSPERAREFVRDFPGYGGGLLADFKWILEKVGTGLAISLNPNWPAGIDMEPGMVEQLSKMDT
jgi:hypothetical protein